MRNYTQKIQMFSLIVLIAAATTQLAHAQSAMDSYVQAYEKMGKRSALMFNQMTQQINARAQQASAEAQMYTAEAEAEATLINARAAWLTAVADAEQTRANTLITLEQLRGQTLDNDMKYAQTYYDKKAMYRANQKAKRDAYQARKAELRAQRASRGYVAAKSAPAPTRRPNGASPSN